MADTNRTPKGRDTAKDGLQEALALSNLPTTPRRGPQETRSGLAGQHKQASETRQARRYWVELGDQLWVQNK